MTRGALVALAVAAALVGGCATGSGSPGTLQPQWQPVVLPVPPGPTGRVAPRDALACAGSWYVVGAVVGSDGSTRPAAWTSADGRSWRSLVLVPDDFYSSQAVLSSVGCRDGRIAAIGAKSGGAHGNPRTATWVQESDGSLHSVHAPFELFGGPHALSVNRVAGGTGGWLIAGSRSSGAAAWTSSDARSFRLEEGTPPLASDATRTTGALDSVADGTGWTVVGRAELTGRISPVPVAWTSPDGAHWSREDVPAGTDRYADLERVVADGDRLLAAGVRGSSFGTWERVGGRWRVTGGFGRLDPRGSTAAFVSGLAVGTPGLLAAVSDGVRFTLLARDEGGSWHRVATPERPGSSGDHQLTVASDGAHTLLLADDGTAGHAWLGTWSRAAG